VAAQNDNGSRTALAVGQRQALYREVNERIGDLAEHLDLGEAIPLLCECGNGGCDERLELTRAEYERLRRYPTRFAVLPGHQIPGVERVIEEHERFFVVEKLGEAAAVASGLDPRSRRSAGTGR
jgi:hypothetical protein